MKETPFDAYTPQQIALLVESSGVRKASLPVLQTLILGILAGAFIAFGAMLYTLVITGDSVLGFGLQRWLGGMAFSLGLIFVVLAGAELFTGNNLIVMAWADRKINTRALLRNWLLVYLGNFIGALATAILVYRSGILAIGEPQASAVTAQAIAQAKTALGVEQLIVRGILCNTLVCLSIWMCASSHRVSGKILCILFPISAFVALGFEHSIANMYLIPIGMLSATGTIDWMVMAQNLLPVTLGNIIGGSGFVALVYWLVYVRE